MHLLVKISHHATILLAHGALLVASQASNAASQSNTVPRPPPPQETDQLHPLFLTFSFTGTNYIETLRVQIHANCRIRRIYFSDRLYSEEELPPEFKLFLPIQVRS